MRRTARRSRSRTPHPAGLADIVKLARTARESAHAPFSGFKVGAALRSKAGEVVTGCNIENATYGLTLCAERVAVFKAVSEGIRGFDAVAVVVDSPKVASPCGPCRQILWEFCGDIWVRMENLKGRGVTRRMSELLPMAFDQGNL